MTTAKKYQVFVSSTFVDLKDERQAVIRHILDLKRIPAGMELFPAADFDQLDYIKKIIDECDYYVLILGGRYGSMDPGGVSYTEREYDYAVATGKVVLAFVHDDVGSIAHKNVEPNHAAKLALDAFREKVMSGRLVRAWRDQQSLEVAVVKALVHAFNDHPQVGWIRGDALAATDIIEQSNRLLQENADLKAKIESIAPAKVEPIISDLADFDDLYDVRYSYKVSIRGSVSFRDTSCALSWRQIFVGIASSLGAAAKTISVVKTGVALAVEEFADADAVYSLNSLDQSRILVQLEALGLIKTYMSKASDEKYYQYVGLTPEGRRRFVENTAVRKPPE